MKIVKNLLIITQGPAGSGQRHGQPLQFGGGHEAAEGAGIETNRVDAHERSFNQNGAGTHHRVQHQVARFESHNIKYPLDHLGVKLAPVGEKAVGGVASAEDVFGEKGFPPGGGVLRQFKRLAGADSEMTGRHAADIGEISGVAYQFGIRKDLVFIEGQFQFIDLVQQWKELPIRGKETFGEFRGQSFDETDEIQLGHGQSST